MKQHFNFFNNTSRKKKKSSISTSIGLKLNIELYFYELIVILISTNYTHSIPIHNKASNKLIAAIKQKSKIDVIFCCCCLSMRTCCEEDVNYSINSSDSTVKHSAVRCITIFLSFIIALAERGLTSWKKTKWDTKYRGFFVSSAEWSPTITSSTVGGLSCFVVIPPCEQLSDMVKHFFALNAVHRHRRIVMKMTTTTNLFPSSANALGWFKRRTFNHSLSISEVILIRVMPGSWKWSVSYCTMKSNWTEWNKTQLWTLDLRFNLTFSHLSRLLLLVTCVAYLWGYLSLLALEFEFRLIYYVNSRCCFVLPSQTSSS